MLEVKSSWGFKIVILNRYTNFVCKYSDTSLQEMEAKYICQQSYCRTSPLSVWQISCYMRNQFILPLCTWFSMYVKSNTTVLKKKLEMPTEYLAITQFKVFTNYFILFCYISSGIHNVLCTRSLHCNIFMLPVLLDFAFCQSQF